MFKAKYTTIIIVNFENFIKFWKKVTGDNEDLPEGAAVPALGLSNKAVFEKHGSVKADREMTQSHETYMSEQFTAINVSRKILLSRNLVH